MDSIKIYDQIQFIDGLLGYRRGSPYLPDWTKMMAQEVFINMDFDTMAAEIAQSNCDAL